MPRPHLAEKDRHDYENKVRFKERHYQMLIALAAMRDIPVAVLIREIVVSDLERFVTQSEGAKEGFKRAS